MTRRIFLLSIIGLISLLCALGSNAQSNTINWRMNVKMTSPTEGEVILKAIIEPGWHLYGVELPKGVGPKPTVIDFNQSKGVTFTTELTYSPTVVERTDAMFNCKLSWWDTNVTFRRKFKLTSTKGEKAQITANISFMGCNDVTCLPPANKTLTKIINQ